MYGVAPAFLGPFGLPLFTPSAPPSRPGVGGLFPAALAVDFPRPRDLRVRTGPWSRATASTSIIPPIPGFAATWKHLPAPLGALLWVAAASDALFPAIFFTFFAVFPRPLFRRRLAWALVWTPALLASAGQLAYRYAMV